MIFFTFFCTLFSRYYFQFFVSKSCVIQLYFIYFWVVRVFFFLVCCLPEPFLYYFTLRWLVFSKFRGQLLFLGKLKSLYGLHHHLVFHKNFIKSWATWGIWSLYTIKSGFRHHAVPEGVSQQCFSGWHWQVNFADICISNDIYDYVLLIYGFLFQYKNGMCVEGIIFLTICWNAF